MSTFGLLFLILVSAALLAPIDGGTSTCVVSTRCAVITEAAAKTSAYCTAVKNDLTCLKDLLTDTDCASELSEISSRVTTSVQNFSTYDCGVAGLVASSVLCLIVCVVSMVVKG